MKKFLLFISILTCPNFAYQEKLDQFLSAPTAQAQALRLQFTDKELQQVWADTKAGLPLTEQRKLWLLEEFQQREQQRIASDRIFYLTLALVLLVTLFFIFIFVLYRFQNQTAKELADLKMTIQE